MDVLDKADITCDQTLVETDKVIKVSDFLGKPNIKKYFYALSKISDEKKLKIVFSLIAQESLCVCDIAYILDCSIATASKLLISSTSISFQIFQTSHNFIILKC